MNWVMNKNSTFGLNLDCYERFIVRRDVEDDTYCIELLVKGSDDEWHTLDFFDTLQEATEIASFVFSGMGGVDVRK